MTTTSSESCRTQVVNCVRLIKSVNTKPAKVTVDPLVPTGGRYVALGEYIVELSEIEPHDEWFDAAKDAYLKWKELHHITTTPNSKA